MGNRSTSSGNPASPNLPTKLLSKPLVLNQNQFEFLYVVGKGGFGKVWKVFNKKYNKHYAMKKMLKAKILHKKSASLIVLERNLLSKMNHPFIVNMIFSFQDYENLYIGMDFLTGGDLRYHIFKHKKFTEEQSKFFSACLLLGLEYIHLNKLIHRDIKPENLVLEDTGYLRITDFGIALHGDVKENSQETSGTPGYMAPEVITSQNHNHAVDFFALGVLVYEMMMGKRPYLGKSRKEIKDKMLASQVMVTKIDLPEGWSVEAADFVNRLLQRKPKDRLGYHRGAQEIKEHAWLKYFPWKDLYDKKLKAPFVPVSQDNYDSRYCNEPDKVGEKTLEKYEELKKADTYSTSFHGFIHYNYEEENRNDERFKNPHNIEDSASNLATRRSSFSGNTNIETSMANRNDDAYSGQTTTTHATHRRETSAPLTLSNIDGFLKNYESPVKLSSMALRKNSGSGSKKQESGNDVHRIKII